MNTWTITKKERKQCIKTIEKHLKNYKNYCAAIESLEKQLSFISSNKLSSGESSGFGKFPNVKEINSELSLNRMFVETIEKGLEGLTDIEKKYVECRYFKEWSVTKSAFEIGYSEKSVFVIRNQVMDKLLISLGHLRQIE